MHEVDFYLGGPKYTFKHILINLINFTDISISMRILYNTSLLIESQAFLKSINN